jgi:hypothetical protein
LLIHNYTFIKRDDLVYYEREKMGFPVKIPKIAHFIWSKGTNVSYFRYLTIKTFKDLHPEWKICLYLVTGTKNSKAWGEYKRGTEDWMRLQEGKKTKTGNEMIGLGQWAGITNVAPEQYMKSDGGKRIFQASNKLLTSIAKGFGGVMTEGDIRESAKQLAALSMNPEQYLRTLEAIKKAYQAKLDTFGTSQGPSGYRAVYGQNQPSQQPSQQAAQAPMRKPGSVKKLPNGSYMVEE